VVNLLLDFGGILVDDAVDFSASDQTILQASEIMPFPRKKEEEKNWSFQIEAYGII